MSRLVLDTQVWLDWLVFDDPGAGPLREAYLTRRAEIVRDPACEAELARVLAYDLGRFSLDSAAQAARLAAFQKIALQFENKPAKSLRLPSCSDPDDQKFLELAAAAGADFLVTKDRALLECDGRAPFRIVTPALFAMLEAYRKADYAVFLHPDLVFHVDEPSEDLDRLLDARGAATARR